MTGATIQAKLGAAVELPVAALPSGALREILAAYTVTSDGGERVTSVCAAATEGGILRTPRGSTGKLRHVLRRYGVELELSSGTTKAPSEKITADPPQLRDYQKQAVQALVECRQGAVVIPCGGGKTHVGVAAIATLKQRSLVLCHTRDLLGQWIDRLNAIGICPGVVEGGKDSSEDVTVALIQTLCGWSPRLLDSWLARWGLLILDEAHHVAAQTFSDVVGRCPALYRIGLTATPVRQDGLSDLLYMHFGQAIHTTTAQELRERGLRVDVRVEELRTPFSASLTKGDSEQAWQDAQEALMGCSRRVDTIAHSIAQRAQDGHSVLCLGQRVDYCTAIAQRVNALGVRAEALTGQIPTARRRRLLDEARDGTLRVTVATSLADEGLDVPRLSCLYLAWPASAKSEGRLEQRVGRIARPCAGKPYATVVDVHDHHVPMLSAMWRKRQPVLRAIAGVA